MLCAVEQVGDAWIEIAAASIRRCSPVPWEFHREGTSVPVVESAVNSNIKHDANVELRERK
jgi:hypothetical protein